MAINIQTVSVTPEYPKMIGNQQVFVYVNKSELADKYHYGTTSPEDANIPYAYKGDVYINTESGQLYACIVAGADGVAQWQYKLTIAGSRWYFGNAITGTNTTPTTYNTGITYANVGDVYMNTDAKESRGNLYQCQLAGVDGVATWKYIGNVNSIVHNTVTGESSINVIAEPYKQFTYNQGSRFWNNRDTCPKRH